MLALLTVLIAAGLAVASYWLSGVELRLGRGLLPVGCRAIAWVSVALLLVNPGCPGSPSTSRPLVLLDGSVSMTAAGGRWSEARRAAAELAGGGGEVRLFGDADLAMDSLPIAGESRLAPALASAAASGRSIVVVTDGEISDHTDLPPDLLRRVGVRLFPRSAGPAAALRRLEGPERVTSADTVRLEAEVSGTNLPDSISSVRLVAREGTRILARAVARLAGGGGRASLVIPAQALSPGEHAVSVSLADTVDAEQRDNLRWRVVTVTPTPGVVLAASPPDWDSRFLYRILPEVTELPVQGYVELEPGRWRRIRDLIEVPAAEVRRGLAGADLAIRLGPGARWPDQAPAVWEWVGAGAGLEEGDWYFEPGGASPVGAALAGAPVDSFPPATALGSGDLPQGAWVGLAARLGRRGTPRPALVGWEEGGRRRVTVRGRGLWRWAFRGSAGEQSYRALVATSVDWLLGARPADQSRVRPVRRVVESGRSLAFRLTAPAGAAEEPERVPIRFTPVAGGAPRVDTLRFDGSGNAAVRLEPGIYTYRSEGSERSEGIVVVETYSDEWFPRPVVLEPGEAAAAQQSGERRPRQEPWLYFLAVTALAAEWAVRRRMGLR